MKKGILLLGIVFLASVMCVNAVKFDNVKCGTTFGNLMITFEPDKCTKSGGEQTTIENPSGGSIQGTSDYEIKCKGKSYVIVHRDLDVIGSFVLQKVQFKVPATGKRACMIHEIKPYGLKNDEKAEQIIRGDSAEAFDPAKTVKMNPDDPRHIKFEITNGVIVDFWNGKSLPGADKEKSPKTYFDSFLFNVVPTTKPKGVKVGGKIEMAPSWKGLNKNVPSRVSTKSREYSEQDKFPMLKICGQEFYRLYAEKIYGSTTSSTAKEDPNTLSGRHVKSQKKTEIFVKKVKDKCTIPSYTLSAKYKTGELVLGFLDLPGANFCGTYIVPSTKGEIVNLECTQEALGDKSQFDTSTLECKEHPCTDLVLGIPNKYGVFKTLDKGIELVFRDDNPLKSIKSQHLTKEVAGGNFEGIGANYDLDLQSTADRKVQGVPYTLPQGLVFYKREVEGDSYIDRPRVIGVNSISYIASPGEYVWAGSSPSWRYRKMVWQPPIRAESKTIKISSFDTMDNFYVQLKGGSVSIDKKEGSNELILSNQYTRDPKQKNFPGYEVVVNNKEITEIREKGSILSKEFMKDIKGVTIRKLWVSLIPPVLTGAQRPGPSGGTGGTIVLSGIVPHYVALSPLNGRKMADAKQTYIKYIVRHGETLQQIIDKFGPCACNPSASCKDKNNAFVTALRKKNTGLPKDPKEVIVKQQGGKKTIIIPAIGSTFTRPDIQKELRVIDCPNAAKASIMNKVSQRLGKQVFRGNEPCEKPADNLPGKCIVNNGDYRKSGQVCKIPGASITGKFQRLKCNSWYKDVRGKKTKLGSSERQRIQCCKPAKRVTPAVTKDQVLKARQNVQRAPGAPGCRDHIDCLKMGDYYYCDPTLKECVRSTCDKDGDCTKLGSNFYCDLRLGKRKCADKKLIPMQRCALTAQGHKACQTGADSYVYCSPMYRECMAVACWEDDDCRLPADKGGFFGDNSFYCDYSARDTSYKVPMCAYDKIRPKNYWQGNCKDRGTQIEKDAYCKYLYKILLDESQENAYCTPQNKCGIKPLMKR